MDFVFFMAKVRHMGKETALTSIADSKLSKLDQQNAKESDCQTLPRQGPSKFPASQKKSVRYVRPLGQS